MNKVNKDMEMWKVLSKEQKERLVVLLEKKESQTLTKEEAQEYGRIIGKALSLSCLRWGA